MNWKLPNLTVFDVVVLGVALAYVVQFPLLTFVAIPKDNMAVLSDGVKDLRGLFGLIVGGYIGWRFRQNTEARK